MKIITIVSFQGSRQLFGLMNKCLYDNFDYQKMRHPGNAFESLGKELLPT